MQTAEGEEDPLFSHSRIARRRRLVYSIARRLSVCRPQSVTLMPFTLQTYNYRSAGDVRVRSLG